MCQCDNALASASDKCIGYKNMRTKQRERRVRHTHYCVPAIISSSVMSRPMYAPLSSSSGPVPSSSTCIRSPVRPCVAWYSCLMTSGDNWPNRRALWEWGGGGVCVDTLTYTLTGTSNTLTRTAARKHDHAGSHAVTRALALALALTHANTQTQEHTHAKQRSHAHTHTGTHIRTHTHWHAHSRTKTTRLTERPSQWAGARRRPCSSSRSSNWTPVLR